MSFNSKETEVDYVQRSELSLLGNIRDGSVFGVERYNSLKSPHDMEKGGHNPDVKVVREGKDAFDVDQWEKWSVDIFNNVDK